MAGESDRCDCAGSVTDRTNRAATRGMQGFPGERVGELDRRVIETPATVNAAYVSPDPHADQTTF